MSSAVERGTQSPFGSPRFDAAVRRVNQHKVEPRRRGRERVRTEVVLLKNLAWKEDSFFVTGSIPSLAIDTPPNGGNLQPARTAAGPSVDRRIDQGGEGFTPDS
jgi:hypothetical protein